MPTSRHIQDLDNEQNMGRPITPLNKTERKRLLAYLEHLKRQSESELRFFIDHIVHKVPVRFAAAKTARHKAVNKACDTLSAFLAERQ